MPHQTQAHVGMSECIERNKRSRCHRQKHDSLLIPPQDGPMARAARTSRVFSTAAVASMVSGESCSDPRTASAGSSRAGSVSSSTGKAATSNGGRHSNQRKSRKMATQAEPGVEHETNGRGVGRSTHDHRVHSSSDKNHEHHDHDHRRQTLTSSSRSCAVCDEDFTTMVRAHKCRLCRLAVCISCSTVRVFVDEFAERQRACHKCVRQPYADEASTPGVSNPGDTVGGVAMPRVAVASSKATGSGIRVGSGIFMPYPGVYIRVESGVVLPRPHASKDAIRRMDMARTASVLVRGQAVGDASPNQDGAVDVAGRSSGGYDDGGDFGGGSRGTGIVKKPPARVVVKARVPCVVARAPKAWPSPLAEKRRVVAVVPARSDEKVVVIGGKDEAGSSCAEWTPKGIGLREEEATADSWDRPLGEDGGEEVSGRGIQAVVVEKEETKPFPVSVKSCGSLQPEKLEAAWSPPPLVVSSVCDVTGGASSPRPSVGGECGGDSQVRGGDAEEDYRCIEGDSIAEDIVETVSAASPCGTEGGVIMEAMWRPDGGSMGPVEVGSSVDDNACPHGALRVTVSAAAVVTPEEPAPGVSAAAAAVECNGQEEEGPWTQEVAVPVPTTGCRYTDDETNCLGECEPSESDDDNPAAEDTEHGSVPEAGCLWIENDGGIGRVGGRGDGEVVDSVSSSFSDSCDGNATWSGDDAAGSPVVAAAAAVDVRGDEEVGGVLAGWDQCRSSGLEEADFGVRGGEAETGAPPGPQTQETGDYIWVNNVVIADDEAPQPSHGAACGPEDGGMGGVENGIGSQSERWEHRRGGHTGGVLERGVDTDDDSDYELRGSEQHDSDVCSEEGDDYSDTEELFNAIDQLEEEEEEDGSRMPLLPSTDALFSDEPPGSAAAVPPVYDLAAAVSAAEAATARRRSVRISINSVHSELSDWDDNDRSRECDMESSIWVWLEKLNELRRKACSCFVW